MPYTHLAHSEVDSTFFIVADEHVARYLGNWHSEKALMEVAIIT